MADGSTLGGGKFIDGANASDAVFTDGNVGIGTDAPTSKLEVAGNIEADQLCDRNGENCISIADLTNVNNNIQTKQRHPLFIVSDMILVKDGHTGLISTILLQMSVVVHYQIVTTTVR